LRIDLDTAVRGERFTQCPAMLRQKIRIAIPLLVDELRRAFYVREQEGDGP